MTRIKDKVAMPYLTFSFCFLVDTRLFQSPLASCQILLFFLNPLPTLFHPYCAVYSIQIYADFISKHGHLICENGLLNLVCRLFLFS